jgi:hypothetical protein
MTPLEVERLVLRLVEKVVRDLIAFITTIGIGIDEAEGWRILGLPPKTRRPIQQVRVLAA